MQYIRPGVERGHVTLDWLDSRHSFSFGQYYDAKHMGFHDLRVINQDIIAPGGGFATHSHKDMEIITYVMRGELAHKDSLGTVATIRAGEVQRMSAGSGISHSEYNASAVEPVELLQIWLLPEQNGILPGYEQKDIGTANQAGPLQAIVTHGGGDGTLNVHQDMVLYRGLLKSGAMTSHVIPQNRAIWLQMVSGSLRVNDTQLMTGDALGLTEIDTAVFTAETDSEFLLFDLKTY